VTDDSLADNAAAKSSAEDEIQPDSTQVKVDPTDEDAAEAAVKLGDKNGNQDGSSYSSTSASSEPKTGAKKQGTKRGKIPAEAIEKQSVGKQVPTQTVTSKK
jgi:hypothetical protein